MEPKEFVQKPDDSLIELDLDGVGSVDDFIKELEEKEKDLHITADLTIEIEESEFDPRNTPDFVLDDVAAPPMSQAKPKQAPVAANKVPVGAKTRIHELEQEIQSLKKRLAVLREERNDVQEKSDRRLKDFESYKYRMDRERRGSFIDQISNLATQMLPVFDNLDRALNAAKDVDGRQRGDFDQFYDGIVLVNQQVAEVFVDMGVEPIASVGQEFDPHFHEAVAVEDDQSKPPNMITEEMLRGYRIGNRVIRHSMVKVTAGSAAAKAPEAAPVQVEELPSLMTTDEVQPGYDLELNFEDVAVVEPLPDEQ